MGIAIAQEVGLDKVRLENQSAQYLLDYIMCYPDAAERFECWLRGETDIDGIEAPSSISALRHMCDRYLDGELPIFTEETLARAVLGTEWEDNHPWPGTGNKELFEALEIPFPSEESIAQKRLPTGYRRTCVMDCGSGNVPLNGAWFESCVAGLQKGGNVGRILIEEVELVKEDAE